jgi:hypothetical protein
MVPRSDKTMISPGTILTVTLVLALAIGFDAYCLADLAKADVVLRFPHRVWAGIIISTPMGGLFYLTFGRVR